MARHHLDPAPRALHGYFSRELTPALRIDSGDVVSFQTWDSVGARSSRRPDFSEPRDYVPRDLVRDVVLILRPVRWQSMAPGPEKDLEIRINRIRTGRWGWSAGPGAPAARSLSGVGPGTGRTSRRNHRAARGSGYILGARSGSGNRHRPFGAAAEAAAVHGNNGYAPRSTGHSIHLSSHPVRRQSGLPRADGRHGAVSADRGRWRLFSTGDGHAVQGDGEVAGPAAELPNAGGNEFRLHPELGLGRRAKLVPG